MRLGGEAMAYATALEFMPVTGPVFTDTGGEPEAAVFTIAYQLKGAEPRRRPVCFAFNGGPGSASIWLHLGALGPKRVQVNDDGSMPPPPYAVSDNPHSWFEHFDLVFIDPPHTGYSIAASEEARTKLLWVDGDVEALAEVMRAWLAQDRRWDSPIYLAGESYGTTRGAALADRLQSAGRRPLRPGPRLLRDGPAVDRLRAAQRPALRVVPARLRRRRAVPRQARRTRSPSRPRRRARRPRPSSRRTTCAPCIAARGSTARRASASSGGSPS